MHQMLLTAEACWPKSSEVDGNCTEHVHGAQQSPERKHQLDNYRTVIIKLPVTHSKEKSEKWLRQHKTAYRGAKFRRVQT